MTYQIIRFLMFIISISILIRISIPYLLMFLNFMFNQKYERYDKRVEKPRLLFHIIGFIIMALVLFPLKEYANIITYNKEIFLLGVSADVLLFGASLVVFLLGVAVSLFSWSNIFKDKYIPKIEQALDDEKELNLKKDINVEEITKKMISKDDIKKASIAESSINDLELFLKGKSVNNKIIWILKAPRSKDINVISIFDLFNEIIEGEINPLYGAKRKHLFHMITENFIKDKEEFKGENLGPRYSEWLKRQNKKKE